MNHTPGPWDVIRGRDKTHPYYVESQHSEHEGFDLAHCVEPADARLIAAAPDLLAALRELVQYVHDEFSCSHPLHEAADRASAAISQAQQGQQTNKV